MLLISSACFSQEKDTTLLFLPDKAVTSLSKNATTTEERLDKATDKYLSKLLRQESKLRSKLAKKDSMLAKQLFNGVEEKYASLRNAPQKLSKLSSVYSPHLDSLTTGLKFLENNPLAGKVDLQKQLAGLSTLQSKLNQTETIKKFIAQRRQLLKENLERLGMLKNLKGFQKEAYYYTARINEVRSLWESPDKLERRLLEEVVKLPAFKEFFARNSTLGSLFALPGGGSGNAAPSLAGLQTRASVMAGITQRFGSGAGLQQLQQNVQAAQGQLSELKNKIASLGSGSFGNSGGDVDLPKGFRPNNQKTKTFFQRLEYGANIQSQKARGFFPTSSDLGLSIGYKLNDKSSIGIGMSYKIGWGRSWDNIRISSEGLGLRSYVEYQLRGSLYLNGGYEQNYRTAFNSIEQLKNYRAWQSSGLLGLSKKYKVSKKIKGDMKLLWDFLSYRQIPRTQAVIFRIGYSLK